MIVTSISILYSVINFAAKTDSVQKALAHWLPFIIFVSCVLCWFSVDPVLFHKYPRVAIYALGLCFGEMVVCEISRNFQVECLYRVDWLLHMFVWQSMQLCKGQWCLWCYLWCRWCWKFKLKCVFGLTFWRQLWVMYISFSISRLKFLHFWR